MWLLIRRVTTRLHNFSLVWHVLLPCTELEIVCSSPLTYIVFFRHQLVHIHVICLFLNVPTSYIYIIWFSCTLHSCFVPFQLKKELDAFDPAFFEEIEDLKYNYQEAVKKNIQYEEQLVALAKQFGVSVPCLELWVWDLYWICYQVYWPILKTSLGEILSATCVIQNSIQMLVGLGAFNIYLQMCRDSLKEN